MWQLVTVPAFLYMFASACVPQCYKGCRALSPGSNCATICACSSLPASHTILMPTEATDEFDLEEHRFSPSSQPSHRHPPSPDLSQPASSSLVHPMPCHTRCLDLCPDSSSCLTSCYGHFCARADAYPVPTQAGAFFWVSLTAIALFSLYSFRKTYQKPGLETEIDPEPLLIQP